MGNANPAITGVAILGIFAIPFFWQRARAGALRGELGELAQRRSAAEAQIDQFAKARAIFGDARPAGTHSAKSMLAHAVKPVDAAATFRSVGGVLASSDLLGRVQTMLPLADLTRAEFEQMLAEAQAFNGNSQIKGQIIGMLALFAPANQPEATLAALLKIGAGESACSHVFGKWADADPDGALAWFKAQRDAGALDSTATYNSPEAALFAKLLGGVAKQAPEKAVDLLLAMDKDVVGSKYGAAYAIAEGIGRAMKNGAGDSQLQRLLEWNADGNAGTTIVAAAMTHAMAGLGSDEVGTFVERYIDEPRQQQALVTAHYMKQHDMPLEERVEQLTAYLPEDKHDHTIRFLVDSYLANGSEGDTRAWVERQPSGLARDIGLSVVSRRAIRSGDFEGAMAEVEQIDDAKLRADELRSLGKSWMKRHEQAARAALPADLIQSLTK